MGKDCQLYCGFECFECMNKRALLLREKALKSSTLPGGEPRKIKSIKEDEDHPPRRRATLQTIIEVIKDELDMAWDMKMQHAAVDPKKQEDHQGLKQVIVNKDEEEKPLRLGKGDNIIADTQAMNKRGSHSDPSSWTGEDHKLQRWIDKGKRFAISISDGEDKRSLHKRKMQKKAEAAPRVELRQRDIDDPAPALPEDFWARVTTMEGIHPILVLQKQLFKTDIAKVENRLSIPVNQIRRQFLTEEEERRVVEGMEVTIIEPSLEVSHIMLKKWKMKTTCYLYVFTTQWNSLVTRNSLKAGDMVQVWSFRVGSESRFALVKVA